MRLGSGLIISNLRAGKKQNVNKKIIRNIFGTNILLSIINPVIYLNVSIIGGTIVAQFVEHATQCAAQDYYAMLTIRHEKTSTIIPISLKGMVRPK